MHRNVYMDRKTYTVDRLVDGYFESVKGTINAETERWYRGLLNRYACGLAEEGLSEWRTRLYEEEIGTGTKNRVIGLVEAVLKYGGSDVTLKRFRGSSRGERRMKVISTDEMEIALSRVQDDVCRRFLAFLFHTGMRRGEAMGLHVTDVHDGRCEIMRSVRRQEETPLKTTGSRRTILLSADARKDIEPLLTGTGYLFGGDRPLPPTTIGRVWSKACDGRYRVHDLRHSFISHALSIGCDPVMVSAYVGHADLMTTMRSYAHVIGGAEDRMMRMIDAYME